MTTDTTREFSNKTVAGLLALLTLVVLLISAPNIGQSMVYDNDRLFMPAFVYIAALVGIGVD